MVLIFFKWVFCSRSLLFFDCSTRLWFSWKRRPRNSLCRFWINLCCGLSFHVTPKFICWYPNHPTWGLWEMIRLWGGTFMNGISGPIKESPECSLALLSHEKMATCELELGSGPSLHTEFAGALIWDFPISGTERNKWCLNYSVYSIFVRADQTDWVL